VFFFKKICQSGADDYDVLANAIAQICSPCKEPTMTFGCEKLKKIRIYCHMQRDKRAQIIMLILSTHISPLPSIKIKPLISSPGPDWQC
jgi:hypothetical protein